MPYTGVFLCFSRETPRKDFRKKENLHQYASVWSFWQKLEQPNNFRQKNDVPSIEEEFLSLSEELTMISEDTCPGILIFEFK